MSWMNQIANVLQNYAQPTGAATDPRAVDADFTQVAQAAPASALASGIAGMFRSNQTPAFGNMVGELFNNSNGEQRATLLNALLSNPAAAGMLGQLARSAGINLPEGGAITPEAAAQIPPNVVQEAAAKAEQHDPSIIDRISQIYSEHPTLIKTLGVAAMGVAMTHMRNQNR